MEISKRTNGKNNSDYGMKDYYHYYYSNSEDPVSRTVFSAIISELNQTVMQMMLNDSFEYRVPHLNLQLTIRKNRNRPKIEDGKLINTAPPDWKRTLTLWDENPEAREKKTLVRHLNHHSSGFVYKIITLKALSTFKNRKYYSFKPSRTFQRELRDRIRDEDKPKFDCFLLYNEKK